MQGVFAIALALTLAAPTPAPSPSGSPKARTFPRIDARSLAGKDYTLPNDFAGEPTLVVITFKKDQADQAKSWSGFATLLEERYKKLRAYNLALIDPHARFFRAFIENGMRSGITDPSARASFLTAFADAAGFRGSLGIEGQDKAVELLVRGDGAVCWFATGSATDEAAARLSEALERGCS